MKTFVFSEITIREECYYYFSVCLVKVDLLWYYIAVIAQGRNQTWLPHHVSVYQNLCFSESISPLLNKSYK